MSGIVGEADSARTSSFRPSLTRSRQWNIWPRSRRAI